MRLDMFSIYMSHYIYMHIYKQNERQRHHS